MLSGPQEIAIGRASELEELLPKVTRAALVQRERFLCNLCPEQTFFGFFDDGVRDEEKKRMAEVLMSYIHQWTPGEILTDIVS